jgi:hypothetical protein
MVRRVNPLKKQVHLGWKYSRVQDLTRETNEKITLEHLVKLLEEMFQDISSWPTDEHVCSYHIRVERDPVRRPCHNEFCYLLKISQLVCLDACLG